MKSFVSVDCS